MLFAIANTAYIGRFYATKYAERIGSGKIFVAKSINLNQCDIANTH